MKEFVFSLNTQMHFGLDAECKVGALLKQRGKKKALIVADAFLKGSELLKRVQQSLTEHGIAYETQADVRPNPTITIVRERGRKAIAAQVDFVIGIGGGSSVDYAKATAIAAANPSIDVEEFYNGSRKIERALQVGAIMTIAATGSENNGVSMVTLDDTPDKVKVSVGSPLLQPVFALMNPANTYSLPKFQLAVGVADLMMHTMERYFTNIDGNELTDQFAEAVLRVAIQKGSVAIRDSHDYDAMSEIMCCGSFAHNGLTSLGRGLDFSCHQMGNIFGGLYNANHGACVSILWPVWAEYVYHTDVSRFARYARNVWGVSEEDDTLAAQKGIAATKNFFFGTLGIPASLKELGIQATEEELMRIANIVTNNGARKIGVFRPLNNEEVCDIYKKAYTQTK